MVPDIFSRTFKLRVQPFENPFFTEELRQIRRQSQRICRKFGRCKKYIEIKNRFDLKLKLEAQKYTQKILTEVLEGKRKNASAALRRLDTGVNTGQNSHIPLPGQAEEDLSAFQSAERLADYFAKISQEFEPICQNNFPPSI